MKFSIGNIIFTDNNEEAQSCLDAGQLVVGTTTDVTCVKYIVEEPEELTEFDLDRIERRLTGKPWNIMQVDNILIRELCIDDVPALCKLYNQEHVKEFMEPLYEGDEEVEYQKNYIKYIYGFYNFGMWLAFDTQNDNKLVGRIGLEFREETCSENEAELGYVIDEQYLRQGLASKLCKKIIEYGFEELDLNRILIRIEKENEVSIHLAEKLGFSFMGQDGKFSCFFKSREL